MISGLAAAGGDASHITLASQAGANAAANNYLNHADATARATLKDKQSKGQLTAAEQQNLNNLEVLDIVRDLALRDACQTQGDVCNAARRDLNAAIASYAGAPAMSKPHTVSAKVAAAGENSKPERAHEAVETRLQAVFTHQIDLQTPLHMRK